MSLQLTDDNFELKLDVLTNSNLLNYELGIFTSSFLIIQVASDNALPVWQKGGWIHQGINFESGIAYTEKKEIDLDVYNLYQFSQVFGDSYKLYYEALSRLKETRIKIWEYQGQVIDLETNKLIDLLNNQANLNINLEPIEIKVSNLEGKINIILDLLGYEPFIEPPIQQAQIFFFLQ